MGLTDEQKMQAMQEIGKARVTREKVIDEYCVKSGHEDDKVAAPAVRTYNKLVQNKADKESAIKKVIRSYRRSATQQARRMYAARCNVPHITVVVDCQAKGKNETKMEVARIRDELVSKKFGDDA